MLTGDILGFVGGQECIQRRDLRRIGVTLHRDALVALLKHLLRIFGFLHRREYVARADAVAADPGRMLERHAAHEVDDRRLGGIVVCVERMTFHARVW